MRGHEQIIEGRKAGRKPEAIYIEIRDYPHGVPAWTIHEHSVYVENSDNPDALDLFFVHRCFVTVSGQDAPRVRRLFLALQEHGAARVLAHVVKPRNDDTFDLIEIIDTAALMAHRKDKEHAHG